MVSSQCGACVLVIQLPPTLVTLWIVAHQALLSMGFLRQDNWSGLPFPSLGVPPDPGIELGSPTLQTDSLPSELPGNKSFTYLVFSKKKKKSDTDK